jgi:CheY-like chemotaxis protein
MKELDCIMLVDDNDDDNFFHERVIKKSKAAKVVIAFQKPMEALEYLKSHKHSRDRHPDLIFLDINMPKMNGWEFLNEYDSLDKRSQVQAIVVMLTTSENEDDRSKAMALNIASDFKSKPLTKEMLEEVISRFFGT